MPPRHSVIRLLVGSLSLCVCPLNIAFAASSQDLVDALPGIQPAVADHALVLNSGGSTAAGYEESAAYVVRSGTIRLSTGLAASGEALGDTDYGVPDPAAPEPVPSPGEADGLPDEVVFRVDFDASLTGPTLTVTSQFVTSEYGLEQPANDEARIWLYWDDNSGNRVSNGGVLLGDVNSSFAAENPRVTTQFNVDGLPNLSMELVVTDGGGNGNIDSALIVSELYFSRDLVTAPPGEPATDGYPQDVNLANGSFSFSKPLINVPGIKLPFSFSLSYNTNWDETTSVGRKWTHNYVWQLGEPTDDDVVRMRKGGGLFEYFELSTNEGDPDNYYVPKYGARDASLSQQADSTWLYITKRQTRYVFDAQRRLASITEPNGNSISFVHVDGRLDHVVDTRGQTGAFSYDADKLVRVDYLSTGGQVLSSASLEYSGDDLVRITDPNGIVTELTYDSDHNILTQTVSDQSDSYRVLENEFQDEKVIAQTRRTAITEFTPEGTSVTSFEYDPETDDGKETVLIDPAGHRSIFYYDTEKSLMTKAVSSRDATWFYYYDDNDQRDQVTEPPKFDPRINDMDQAPMRRMEYDDRGNMTETVNQYNEITSMLYDVRNNLELKTDPAGNSTDYRYDGNNNMIGILFPLGNPEAEFEFDSRGLRTRTINRRGYEATFEYDPVTGEMLRSIDPFGNAISYQYDSLGRKTAMTTASGATTQFVYDAGGRLLETVDPLQRNVIRTYDARGLITRLDLPGTGSQRAQKDYEFDERGLAIAETDALRLRTTYDHDGRGKLVRMTTPAGRVSTYEYDDLGLLSRVTDPAGISVVADYDEFGRRTSFSFPEGLNTFTFEYDLLDRLVSRTDILDNTLSQDFDNRGLVSTITNGRGQEIGFTYDTAGRMTGMTLPERQIVRELDENGNVVRSMGDGPNAILREYDALDRLVSRTDEWGNTVSYAYDANGNLSLLTYSDGKQVRYGYDLVDRLIEVEDWDGNVTRYGYDNADNLSRVELPDGSIIEYRYDIANRMVGVTDTTGRGLELYRTDRTLSDDGLILSESMTLPLEPDLQDSVSSRQYGDMNQLQSVDGAAFDHDADGNLVSAAIDNESIQLEYDSLNRLVSVNGDRYRYDADGLRSEAVINGETVRYVNDPNAPLSRILEEHDADGNITARYVWGAGLISRQGGETGRHLFYHFDTRGSTLALTDSTGFVTDRYAYAPFGKVVSQRGTTDNPFKYVGAHGVITDDNGLYFMRARYYEPNLRRFITRDELSNASLTMPQTLNLYAYAEGDPLRLVDPEGEFGFIGRALAGAVINVTIAVVVDLASGEGIGSWESYTDEAIEGALIGAFGPGGASWGIGWKVGWNVVVGAGSGAIGAWASNKWFGQDNNVGMAAVFGAAGGVIDAGLAKQGDAVMEGFARKLNPQRTYKKRWLKRMAKSPFETKTSQLRYADELMSHEWWDGIVEDVTLDFFIRVNRAQACKNGVAAAC